MTVLYDDGRPMAFCDVAVFAPGNPDETWQEGTSDRNGSFAFLPDTNGTWRVTVDDGMGHRLEADVRIGSAGSQSSLGTHCPDRLGRAVVGTAVLFGCFGLYAMLAARAQRRRTSTGA